MDACRLIIPKKAVPMILQRIHSSHSGLSKTYELARSLYYWPGMYNEIKQVIQRCSVCAKFSASQPHGPRSTQAPSAYYGPPMSQVGVDLFDFGGKAHLVCMDHWSGFPLYCELRSTTSRAICSALSSWFNILGWPRHIRSDGGPQFCSEFSAFCARNGIRHELAAPYNPRSNGLAESGVKICKLMLAKAAETREDPQRLLYEWRNVPRPAGFSPAQQMFGRPQNIALPQPASAFKQIDFEEASRARDRTHAQHLPSYDRGKRKLPALSIGDQVNLQDPHTGQWNATGVVSQVRPDGLSYLVECDGRPLVRARHMLKLALPTDLADQPRSIDRNASEEGHDESGSETPPLYITVDGTPSPQAEVQIPTPTLRRSPRLAQTCVKAEIPRHRSDSTTSSSSRRPPTPSRSPADTPGTRESTKIPLDTPSSMSSRRLLPLESGLAPSFSSSHWEPSSTVTAAGSDSAATPTATDRSWTRYPESASRPSSISQTTAPRRHQLPPQVPFRGSEGPWGIIRSPASIPLSTPTHPARDIHTPPSWVPPPPPRLRRVASPAAGSASQLPNPSSGHQGSPPSKRRCSTTTALCTGLRQGPTSANIRHPVPCHPGTLNNVSSHPTAGRASSPPRPPTKKKVHFSHLPSPASSLGSHNQRHSSTPGSIFNMAVTF